MLEARDLTIDDFYEMTITLGSGDGALAIHGFFVPHPEVPGRQWEHCEVTINGKRYYALMVEHGSYFREKRHEEAEESERRKGLRHLTQTSQRLGMYNFRDPEADAMKEQGGSA